MPPVTLETLPPAPTSSPMTTPLSEENKGIQEKVLKRFTATLAENEKELLNVDKYKKIAMDGWPKVVKRIIEEDPDFGEIPHVFEWLEDMLNRTVPFGKLNRSTAMHMLSKFFKPDMTEKEEQDTLLICWCLEILQTASLIADDIMDNSETRRGKPCWYKNPDVGISALNDSFILQNLVYEIMYRYFRDNEYYADILRFTQRTHYRTILGQCLDTRMEIMKDYSLFTEDTYAKLVKFKTSYYTYVNPTICPMIIAGIKDQEVFDKVEDLMFGIGYYFQVQDDYIDCFGDPKKTGKIGTDILDGKCTWLFVKAMELASPEQKEELKKIYGQKEKESEVKSIYKSVGVQAAYRKFEDKIYAELSAKIRNLPDCVPQHPIREALNAIYKRDA